MDDAKYTISLKDQNFRSTIDSSDEAVNKLESSLKTMAGVALGAFAVSKVVGFGKEMIQLAMDAEQAQVSMEVLLGDAEAAKKMIFDLKKMGAETPFEFTDLQGATQTLLSFGVNAKNVLPTLSKLGDISGGNAEKLNSLARAFGKASAGGKLTGEIVNTMIDASFNPLAILAKELAAKEGISMETAMSKMQKNMSLGKVSVQDLNHAVTVATSEGGQFFQMMQKQSETTAGKLSTLEDNIAVVKTAIGTALLPVVNAGMESMASFVQMVIDGIEWIKNDMVPTMQKYGAELRSLGVFVGILATGFALYTLYVNASAIATGVATIATNVWAAAQWLLNAALTANPIGVVIVAVAAFAAGIYYLWQKSETFRGTLLGLWEVAKVVTGAFLTLAKALILPTPDNISDALASLRSLKDEVPGAFNKGFKQGADEVKKENMTTAVTDKKNTVASPGGKSPAALDTPGGASVPKADKVSSVKPTTINFNIENLVRELQIITQNMGIGKDQIAAEISKVLIGGVVDAQRVAGV